MKRSGNRETIQWRVRSSHRAMGFALAFAAAATSTSAFAEAGIGADDGLTAETSGETPADAPADDDAARGGDIVVTGTTERALPVQAGALGSRTILETPFSISKVSVEDISKIAATTIDAALSYDASVRSNNSGVASGNTFSVRGQAVDRTNGYKFDGLPFPYWFQDHPVEALEQIQILKGAGGFVYGYASPSGIVNFVSKKPTDELVISGNVSFRSSNILREHIDIGGPFYEGSTTKFRLNLVNEAGKLYNGAENRNQFASLWLQGEIAPGLTWSLDGFYQRTWQSEQSNSVSLAAAVTHLDPVNGADFNFGAKSTTKFNDIGQITGKLNYEINDDWHATAAIRHSALDERFPGNTVQILNNAGDYQLGILNMNRLFFYNVAQASIEGKFHTGGIEHDLVAGLDYLDVDFYYDRQRFLTSNATGYPTTTYAFNLKGNIYDGAVPDWGSNPSVRAVQRPPDYFLYQTVRQRGAYFSDTLKYAGWELLAGLRYTNYQERNNEPVLKATSYKESSVTPIVALSYDITKGVRIYASRVQALQRGGLAPDGTTNAGQSFGPLKSLQYEAGIKIEQPTWGATLAAYRTTVPSEYTVTATNTFVRDGEVRYQGIEFNGNLKLSSELSFDLSVAYLDAVQVSALNAAVVGKKVPGTTAFQIAGSVNYAPSFVPGLSLFAGVHHSGKSYGQSTNTFTFDPVTIGDAGATYVLKGADREIRLQANVLNIANTSYWIPNATGTGLSAGAPRTFSLSLGVSTQRTLPTRERIVDGETILGSGWYVGLAAGAVAHQKASYDIESTVDGNDAKVSDGLATKHKTGWELDGTFGHDFGLWRAEIEAAHKQANLSKLDYRDASIAIKDPTDLSHSYGAGTYSDPKGKTRILSVLFNGLLDFGGGEKSSWGFQVGGGVGIARVNQGRWNFEKDTGEAFGRDDKTGFAWQGIASVERRITSNIDLTLKYHYFNVPGIELKTAATSALEGDIHTHSLLLGTNVRF